MVTPMAELMAEYLTMVLGASTDTGSYIYACSLGYISVMNVRYNKLVKQVMFN